MTRRKDAPADLSVADLADFSLVNGGLLNRLWRRTRLTGDALQWVPRRAAVAALLAWLPLLVLSLVEGRAIGGATTPSFLQDIEMHLRLLVAVPLMILAELKVHRRLHPVVSSFVEHGLVPERERPRFAAAVASAMRLRNSALAELLVLAIAYSAGLYVWRSLDVLDVSSWHIAAGTLRPRLSWAGWWAALVSMPIFQFLMLRWYFRLAVWARFLWQVSRIDLNLQPTHPDGTAGLSFLSLTGRVHSHFLVAMGAVVAGMIANRILYTGARLLDFKVEIIGWVALLLLVVLGPLLVFVPKLRAARADGILDYGRLGHRYASEFHDKWSPSGARPEGPLLGSADIQSLADLRNASMVIENMRLAPFGMKNVTNLAAYVLLPMAPLLLTTFSLEQLLDRMLKALF